jgi:hypothetical protein
MLMVVVKHRPVVVDHPYRSGVNLLRVTKPERLKSTPASTSFREERDKGEK